MDQRAAVFMDHVADKLLCRALSQTRLFVYVADDLSAEKPHIVDVVLDGPFRQAGFCEMKEERVSVRPSTGLPDRLEV